LKLNNHENDKKDDHTSAEQDEHYSSEKASSEITKEEFW
jgi:hypothetical protein